MAGPLDTGQLLLTYLFFLPSLFSWLISELHLAIGMLCSLHRLWHSVRFRAYHRPIKHRKKKSFVGRRLNSSNRKRWLVPTSSWLLLCPFSRLVVGSSPSYPTSFVSGYPFAILLEGPCHNALLIRHIPLRPHHPHRKFVLTRTCSRLASTTIAQS